LSCDEFLEPIGHKDKLEFIDFCLLFRCKKFREEGKFGMLDENSEYYNEGRCNTDFDLFPVTITNFGKRM
jgi:hypothetical protein